MAKEQDLNNLYALRAGLSVISQQYDKAQAIDDECDRKLAKNTEELGDTSSCGITYPTGEYAKNLYPELGKLQEKYTDNNKAYNRWIAYDESTQFFQRCLTFAQNNKDSADKGQTGSFNYRKEYKREKRLSILFFIIATIFAVGTIALLLGVLGPWDMSFEIICVFFVPLLVFLILGIVYVFKAKRDKLQHSGKVDRAQGSVIIAQSILQKLPQFMQNARKILKEKDDKIEPIKKNCNDFYMALKKQFNSLLDERDWKNLDLVIYELETRRADSVKEALQLVDRELQTQRIQQTIAQATEQICYEIRRGFAALQATIIECSRIISAQLATISLQLCEVNSQLSELTDGVNMSNALQAKANVTSAQLLSDVHAIRYYQ